MVLYSFTKRWTLLSHIVLGWCLSIAPTGAWIAVRGAIDSPVPLLLSLALLWLYRRMYFDELYFSVFVAITMALSKLCAAFDRYFIDGVVNGVASFVRNTAFAVGLNDKYVVDGAVNGVADLAQDIGAAVRAPQSGRIRMYVTVLMIAVTLGLAGAVIVALSR